MGKNKMTGRYPKASLKDAMLHEAQQFEQFYLWIEKHMAPNFFEEVEEQHVMLIAHHLMGFHLTGYFTKIELENCAIVLCPNTSDADLRILRDFKFDGIKNYIAFISDEPPPCKGMKQNLRVGLIYYTEMNKQTQHPEDYYSKEKRQEIYQMIKEKNPELSFAQFEALLHSMNTRFLKSLNEERFIMAIGMYCRAVSRVNCQYEVVYNKDYKRSKKNIPSVQIVLAWRDTPKYRFLYRLAKLVFRHNLTMARVGATYIDPYEKHNVLVMSLGLNGMKGKAAWQEADFDDFLRELVMLKYFDDKDQIDEIFVKPLLLSGNLANFLRTAHTFVHQTLVHANSNLYSFENIGNALCRHPDLTAELCHLFELRFSPTEHNDNAYKKLKKGITAQIKELDTGNEEGDTLRRNVLNTMLNFIQYALKTNFYRKNKNALAYRLDPTYLDHLPYDRKDKFPEVPFAIFFIQGMHFISFHIRFKDLARGGLRTVFPKIFEQMQLDRNTIFSECYNLAYTQQKKNKDIPEGGAKAVILLEPFDRISYEAQIYTREMRRANIDEKTIETTIKIYCEEQKLQYLYNSQRSFIFSLLSLINCHDNGTLKHKDIVDYWGKSEYIYLGPDENMHNAMIERIAKMSAEQGYKLGTAFISSKPSAGVNHKEYGVTSLGVNVCMEEILDYLEIDPYHDPFTVKMTGGPDGDVAGNEILNLHKYYPHTAKLVALIDGTGTIHDPAGVDLPTLVELFHKGAGIHEYPPEKLSEKGYLLDNLDTRDASSYSKQVKLYTREKGRLIKKWILANEANHLLRHNVHETPADIFIPAGGRPRTLNANNYTDFLSKKGKPTAKAIIEGANLYLTAQARYKLEEKGVLIIKDSSANKGGVICSSFEVLCGLVMGDAAFVEHKHQIMEEVLGIIRERAREEASLILRTHCETGASLIDASIWTSDRINKYTYEILDYLQGKPLPKDPKHPLIQCLFNYCPPILRKNYKEQLLQNIPDIHKKAIIACFIGSKIVYTRGLSWSPSIADILPLVANDPHLLDPTLET